MANLPIEVWVVVKNIEFLTDKSVNRLTRITGLVESDKQEINIELINFYPTIGERLRVRLSRDDEFVEQAECAMHGQVVSYTNEPEEEYVKLFLSSGGLLMHFCLHRKIFSDLSIKVSDEIYIIINRQ